MEPNYTYADKVLRVIDGDTYLIDVDLGFHTHTYTRIRLDGVSCPEMSTPEGIAARDWVVGWIALNDNNVVIITKKAQPQSFERYVAEVWVSSFNLATSIVNKNLGKYV